MFHQKNSTLVLQYPSPHVPQIEGWGARPSNNYGALRLGARPGPAVVGQHRQQQNPERNGRAAPLGATALPRKRDSGRETAMQENRDQTDKERQPTKEQGDEEHLISEGIRHSGTHGP